MSRICRTLLRSTNLQGSAFSSVLLTRPNSSQPNRRREPLESFRCSMQQSVSEASVADVVVETRREVKSVTPAAVHVHDHLDAPAILQDIDTCIFDCDGVLWLGDTLIPHAKQVLLELRQQGKRLLFVTNNSTKSRRRYVEKFQKLGLSVEAHEIISSSYAAAAYLADVSFPKDKKVFLIGTTGVAEELELHGISYIGGESGLGLPPLNSMQSVTALQENPAVGAVVVGWDPMFDYSKLVYASVCLREHPGCLFVATNTDACDNCPSGRMMPGTGCMVAAVANASGVQPVVAGKGGSWLLPFLMKTYNIQPSRAVIIGDRLVVMTYAQDTDILLGKQGGLTTILTLTGVCQLDDVAVALPDSRPDFVIPSIAALIGVPTAQGQPTTAMPMGTATSAAVSSEHSSIIETETTAERTRL